MSRARVERIIHSIKTMKVRNDVLIITRFKDFSIIIEREGREVTSLSPQQLFVDWFIKEYSEREWERL